MQAADASSPRFLDCGDTALIVEFGDTIDREIAQRVGALARRLDAAPPAGLIETVPTFRSLMVQYDPDTACREALEEQIAELIATLEPGSEPSRRWTLPACYDAAVAPDLDDVAERTGLSPAQVVECHAAETYFVYMIGFLPGYPYMGDLPEPLVLPRRETPRTRVPPGSVAIAQTLTAVYPQSSPGGWHLIGWTPVPVFAADDPVPAKLAPGDRVRFDPFGIDDCKAIETRVSAGRYTLLPDPVAS